MTIDSFDLDDDKSREPPRTTTWWNKTSHPVRFTLFTSEKRRIQPKEGVGFEAEVHTPHEILIPPGGSRTLLSIYDSAAWQGVCDDARCKGKKCVDPTRHKGFRKLGGLAPMLSVDGVHAPSVEAPPAAVPEGDAALIERARRRRGSGK